MYIGSGTVQVSATIELHGDSDIAYQVHGNHVEITFGPDNDACLVLTGRGTERFAEKLNQALAELRRHRQ